MTDSMARSNNGAALRGVLLVIIAIAVGVVLLRSSDDSTGIQVGAGAVAESQEPGVTAPLAQPDVSAAPEATTAPVTEAPAASTSTPAGDSAEQPTPTTVPDVQGFEARPSAEVTVQVANSTSVKGAAGSMTDQLKTLNYITATPTNMRGTALERTRIHYMPGSLLEAQVIAEILGLDGKNDVFQMFQDTSAIDQWDEPDVLVALGNDLADAG